MESGEEGLGHLTRKQIFNYISSHPGSSFGNIRSIFELNESTLKYHLNYLERTKKIESRKEGRRRCYYCQGEYGEDEIGTVVRSEPTLTANQQRIINVIRRRPGITNKDLVARTKLNRKTVSYNLERLIEKKVLWKIKADGVIGYEYITEEKLRKEMYNQLLIQLLSDEIDEDTFLKIKKKLESLDIDEI